MGCYATEGSWAGGICGRSDWKYRTLKEAKAACRNRILNKSYEVNALHGEMYVVDSTGKRRYGLRFSENDNYLIHVIPTTHMSMLVNLGPQY